MRLLAGIWVGFVAVTAFALAMALGTAIFGPSPGWTLAALPAVFATGCYSGWRKWA